jgi:hypothetical protein
MLSDRIDDPESSMPGYAALTVDLRALSDLAGALRREVDANLQPHITQLFSAYSLGVGFGLATDSANIRAARQRYQDCLTQIGPLLSGFVTAGQALAAAADQIATAYGDSDAMAKARASTVQDAVSQATSTIAPAAPVIDRGGNRPGNFA